jgi:hypothetical protein
MGLGAWPRQLRVDTVEKVFWGWRTKFSRAADAFRAQRCEGPLRFSEKRPRTFVLALCSIPAADSSKNQHLRDFWSFSIFDFFNSIGQSETSNSEWSMSVCHSIADLDQGNGLVSFVPKAALNTPTSAVPPE